MLCSHRPNRHEYFSTRVALIVQIRSRSSHTDIHRVALGRSVIYWTVVVRIRDESALDGGQKLFSPSVNSGRSPGIGNLCARKTLVLRVAVRLFKPNPICFQLLAECLPVPYLEPYMVQGPPFCGHRLLGLSALSGAALSRSLAPGTRAPAPLSENDLAP